jgi:hypothetical protein
MTRINSAISVKSLSNEHLLVEHREIKRLPTLLKQSKNIASKKIPNKFCLGTGHVTFFLDKMLFTLNRYKLLHKECLERGFIVTDYSSNWNDIPNEYMNDYVPTNEEKQLLIDIIKSNIMNGKQNTYHYYGDGYDRNGIIKKLYE